MEKILLSNVLPHVFEGRADLHSDIWRQEVSLERGHLYLVEAASGTGKSTLCSYLIGYRHDYTGRITFDGDDVMTYDKATWTRLRQRHVSHLFQELRLFPELTARENVEIKNQLTAHTTPREIETWFERLGIADKLDSRVGQMSFGQQQRVAMVRALVQPFDFIIVDEPISHLDDENSHIMADIMTEEAQRQGAGIIVTSIGKHMELPYEKTFKL